MWIHHETVVADESSVSWVLPDSPAGFQITKVSRSCGEL